MTKVQSQNDNPVYSADRSLYGKLRRRVARLMYRRPVRGCTLEAPMLSFAFDDAPRSAALTGAQLLEDAGARGTYYINAGLFGQDGPMGPYTLAEDVQKLAEAGHEIGCHTFSHLDCGKAPGQAIRADIEANATALSALGVPPMSTFAYPYGDVSPQAKQALDGRFALLRGLHHGVIQTGSDLNQAPAVGIEGPKGEEIARFYLERVKTEGGWLILYSHDVQNKPSEWGCTPEALRRLIDAAGPCQIVTVAEGARRLAESRA